MAKEYGHQYLFAGSSTSAGPMVCVVCNKPINNKEHDWLLSMKSLKHDDWKYVCRHRHCVSYRDGWLEVEKRKAKFDSEVDKIITDLLPYVGGATFSNELLYAMKYLGWERIKE